MNANVIEEFRAKAGVVGGYFEGMPMVLLHSLGAKSGIERINPLVFLPDEADASTLYIFASKAGAPSNPDWYYNVVANPTVTVEVGDETFEATASELHGAQRDEVFAKAASRYSTYAEYEKMTDRVIPVIALTRNS